MSSAHFLCFELHDIDTVVSFEFCQFHFRLSLFPGQFDSPRHPVKLFKRDSPMTDRDPPSAIRADLPDPIAHRYLVLLDAPPAGPYGTYRAGANRCARVDCPPRAGARHRPSPQPTPCSLSGITPHTDRQTSPSMHTSQATSRAPPSDMRLRALPSPAAFVRTLASTRPPRRPARPHHMHSRGPCLRRGRSLIISPYRLRAACASVRARKFSSLRLASAEGFDLLLRLRSRPAGA